jgi:hypothetical protein
MHIQAFQFVESVLRGLPRRERVLEIGSRDINGSIRQLFAGARWYCGIDCAPGAGVDCVADGASFRTEEAPDTVVCCEVLEHAEQGEAIVRNAFEQLQSGGVAIFTMATEGRAPHSAVHGGALQPGEYYRNVGRDALLGWCRDFASVEIAHYPERGDLYALARKAGSVEIGRTGGAL